MVRNRVPSYRLHKPSGLAVVTLNGKDHYLGKHGSEESRAEYNRLMATWHAGGRKLPAGGLGPVTINELLIAFWRHAERYYRKHGQETTHLRFIRVVGRDLGNLFGSTPATGFRPFALKALRQTWIDARLGRETINKKVSVVRQIFDWAAEHEMIPGDVAHTLRAVRGLAKGRSEARESDPVRPAPEKDVEATVAKLRRFPAAMVRLQLLTGMRPGEVCGIRPVDIDRSGPVWSYTPASHKTEHHGKSRTIALGPRAQAILGPFLEGVAKPTDHVFQPRAEKRDKAVHTIHYRQTITRACKRAGVPHWHPNQLRHNYATHVRKQFGLDAAQVMLGHSHADVTQVYAEADRERMSEVASRIG